MAAGLLVVFVGGVLGAVPYPPATISSLVVRATPGGLATRAIETLGHLAQRGLAVGVHAAVLLAGAAVGVWVRRGAGARSRARRALAAGSLLFAVAALLSLAAPEGLSALSVAVLAAGAVTFAGVVAGGSLLAAADAPPGAGPPPDEAVGPRSRRRFLAGAAAAVGGLLVGGAAVWRLVGGTLAAVPGRIARAVRPFTKPAPDPAFPDVAGHTPELTPTEDFYNVDINFVKPRVDHTSWTLSVGGAVDRPYELTWDTLQSDFEVVELAHTLTCISNEVGGDLISTTVWRGVRLRDVLERAGLQAQTADIVFTGAENYTDSIPLAKALEDRTLVVFGMDGAPLPRDHGFPARIIVPGIYGMKNVKWVQSIEAVPEDYQGYWMQRGWSDVAVVKTQSRIDVPAGGSTVAEGSKAAGVAWAGDRGVSAVEVSEDGGQTWRMATLERELSDVAWRRWVADLGAGTGARTLVVRARDGAGQLQESRRTRTHPDGASGYHKVRFDVRGR
jgi:DMSO/TMAO reductase YedYZ molybdopterin-dependent catalytic subunit